MVAVSKYDLFLQDKWTANDLRGLSRYDLLVMGEGVSERSQVIFRNLHFGKRAKLVAGNQTLELDSGGDDWNVAVPPEDLLDYHGCADLLFRGVNVSRSRIAIDITAISRPMIMFLTEYLRRKGAEQLDFFYVEPSRYIRGEKTLFGSPGAVRDVPGFSGINNGGFGNVVLIVAAGYESELVRKVAQEYERSHKIVILGLPSTQPDFFQESIIRICDSEDLLSEATLRDVKFSPAHDPFFTARLLSDLVGRQIAQSSDADIYLAPLSTKPAALGFALYWIGEVMGNDDKSGLVGSPRLPVNIIFPFGETYRARESVGVGAIWQYMVNFKILRSPS
jgi:hypothetical protein